MCGSASTSRARASCCACAGVTARPPDPTSVSSPSGRACTHARASTASQRVAQLAARRRPGGPAAGCRATVPTKTWCSWVTSTTCPRRSSSGSSTSGDAADGDPAGARRVDAGEQPAQRRLARRRTARRRRAARRAAGRGRRRAARRGPRGRRTARRRRPRRARRPGTASPVAAVVGHLLDAEDAGPATSRRPAARRARRSGGRPGRRSARTYSVTAVTCAERDAAVGAPARPPQQQRDRDREHVRDLHASGTRRCAAAACSAPRRRRRAMSSLEPRGSGGRPSAQRLDGAGALDGLGERAVVRRVALPLAQVARRCPAAGTTGCRRRSAARRPAAAAPSAAR